MHINGIYTYSYTYIYINMYISHWYASCIMMLSMNFWLPVATWWLCPGFTYIYTYEYIQQHIYIINIYIYIYIPPYVCKNTYIYIYIYIYHWCASYIMTLSLNFQLPFSTLWRCPCSIFASFLLPLRLLHFIELLMLLLLYVGCQNVIIM